MTSDLIQFGLSAMAIVVAGAVLTQFADAISNKTRLGQAFVGALLLAGATSLPELAIDVSSIRIGAVDLAVGDLLGSSLFNLLILAILDMTWYSKGRMLSYQSAAHVLPAGVSVVLVSLAGIFMTLASYFQLPTLGRVGLGSMAIMAAYLLGASLVYFGQREGSEKSSTEEKAYWIPGLRKMGFAGAVGGYVAMAGVIILAAPFLATSAESLAERSGLGDSFFGTFFVALCTSLPEMATTFTAVRMGAFNMALGNIFGSNCFNMALLFPLDFFHPESLLGSVSGTHIFSAFCVVLATMVVVLGQLYKVEKKNWFFETDAWLVILLIGGALFGVYSLRGY